MIAWKQTGAIDREQLVRWVRRARGFRDREVSRLRLRIQLDPSDIEARGLLLGCGSEAERQAQALWLIEHEPAIAIAVEGLNTQEHPLYPIALRLWLSAIGRFPDDINVFRNATLFFFRADPVLAESLLQDALKRHPRTEVWVSAVAERYDCWLGDEQVQGERMERRLARQALVANRQAIVLSQKRAGVGKYLHVIGTLLQRARVIKSLGRLPLLQRANQAARRALKETNPDRADALVAEAFRLADLAINEGDASNA